MAYRLTETGRSTATSYHFRGAHLREDGTEGRHEGWAICTVNDQTGELAIQSDWTDGCAHRWHVDHLGATLTDFIARKSRYFDYFVGKLLPPARREQFSADRTIKALRAQIIANRRGEAHGRLTRDLARDRWDELATLQYITDATEFFAELPDAYREQVFENPEFEFCMQEPTREAEALAGWILPALAEACRAEVARRAERATALAAQVDAWNAAHPIGTRVLVAVWGDLQHAATAGQARGDGDRAIVPLWGTAGSYGERDVETPVHLDAVWPVPAFVRLQEVA